MMMLQQKKVRFFLLSGLIVVSLFFLGAWAVKNTAAAANDGMMIDLVSIVCFVLAWSSSRLRTVLGMVNGNGSYAGEKKCGRGHSFLLSPLLVAINYYSTTREQSSWGLGYLNSLLGFGIYFYYFRIGLPHHYYLARIVKAEGSIIIIRWSISTSNGSSGSSAVTAAAN
jgi:hypothetical protein